MKQHGMDGQVLAQNQSENTALLKYSVLVLGLGILGIILLSGIYYLLSSGPAVTLSPNAGAIAGPEQLLSADYVLQPYFIYGRYLLPFLISLLFTGVMLFWVLKSHKKAKAS